MLKCFGICKSTGRSFRAHSGHYHILYVPSIPKWMWSKISSRSKIFVSWARQADHSCIQELYPSLLPLLILVGWGCWGVCELLLCSVHSSSYSGGKQKSDRQIYYSVIDITDTVHNKTGHLFKTKQYHCSGGSWYFFWVSLSLLGGGVRSLLT